jgi:hypothetical protein
MVPQAITMGKNKWGMRSMRLFARFVNYPILEHRKQCIKQAMSAV